MKKILILVVLAFLSINLSAQDLQSSFDENAEFSASDTIQKTLTDIQLEEQGVQSEIDSLLSLWYIKKTINEEFKDVKSSSDPIFYSDSVYEHCLKQIPTTFPLVYNQHVRQWIEMYIRRGKYLIPTLLGLSQYYFPMIEPVFDQYGIPLELKYLTIVESALNPRAVSRAGATGLWQFMFGTGKMYDLEVTTLVDERKDPFKETYAAAKLLKDLYKIYGDWALVIAAYNCGPGNVNKAIRRSGGKTNFWDLYPYLPVETRGYVPAFISVNYIMNFYKQHNYAPVKVDMPIYNDTVMITKKLHFEQISQVLGISVDMLRDLNPQFKKDIVPGDIKHYALRLPAETALAFVEKENEIYSYKDSVYFAQPSVYVVENKPLTSASSANTYAAPCDNSIPAGTTKLVYTVKSGDTYGFIANWYDVSVTKLKCWNNVTSNRLSVGQKLNVYVPTKNLNQYRLINSQSFEQKQAAKSNAIVQNSKTPLDKNFEYYSIKKGDNISTIASRYPGVSEADIKRINGFSDLDVRRLQIGQVIKIRRK